MKIKKLPNVLALHLKRFKYQEDVGRYIKLAYRVAFPLELRLFNTVDDAQNPDRLYELFAIVVHIGKSVVHRIASFLLYVSCTDGIFPAVRTMDTTSAWSKHEALGICSTTITSRSSKSRIYQSTLATPTRAPRMCFTTRPSTSTVPLSVCRFRSLQRTPTWRSTRARVRLLRWLRRSRATSCSPRHPPFLLG